MGVKLLTFLGANLRQYRDCEYEYKGQALTRTKFVQKALLEALHEREGIQDIEFVIFLTEAAKRNCWEVPEGLKEELQDINYIQIKEVEIVDGQDTISLWKIFSKILEQLQDGDRVVFDVTYSFRYIPMIALLVSHFARVTRDLSIEGIYYGNVGSEKNKDEDDIELQPPAIVDLKSFIDMQEWITNIYAFEKTGRAKPLLEWAENRKMGREDPRKEFIEDLNNLTQALETNRGPELGNLANKVIASLKKLKNEEIIPTEDSFKPLELLLNKIEKKISPIAADDQISAGLAAVRWCVEHGLIQQAYTMLDEITCIAICKSIGLSEKDVLNYQKRRDVSYAVCGAYAQNIYSKIVGKKLKNEKKLVSSYWELKQDRNDLNHAGWSEKKSSSNKLIDNMRRDKRQKSGKYEQLIELVDRFWQEQKFK